jgi:hypothetical protein
MLGVSFEATDSLMNNISEPNKLKAETTYNAAADHVDDGPLAFWDRYGRRTGFPDTGCMFDVGCRSGASFPVAHLV